MIPSFLVDLASAHASKVMQFNTRLIAQENDPGKDSYHEARYNS
jgi:hypothetical protein